MEVSPTPIAATEANPTPTPVKRSPNDEPGDPTLNTSNSFWLDNYPLNDLFQYLARQANYQFFQNPFIDAIKVTGELFKGNDPLENMRELALQYNLILFQKGRTLYALTQDQIATLAPAGISLRAEISASQTGGHSADARSFFNP